MNSIVYQIPQAGCDNSYYGGEGHELNTRIYEYKWGIRHHRTFNAVVDHLEKESPLPSGKMV